MAGNPALVRTMSHACQSLGLSWHMAAFDMHGDGVLEGVPVRLAWVPSGFAGAVLTTCALSPPLGLGLQVSSPESEMGPRQYAVSCDEPELAHALLTDALRAVLERCSWRGHLALDDSALTLKVGVSRGVDPGLVIEDVRALASAAQLLQRTRAQCPAPAALAAHAQASDAYARAHGYSATQLPLSLFGSGPHGNLFVGAERAVRGSYTLSGRLLVDRVASSRLELAPAQHRSLMDRLWTGLSGGAQVTGDPVFDAAFVTHAPSPEVARALLTDPVRRLLVDLAQRYGELHLHEGTLLVGPAPLPLARPAVLGELADELGAVAALLLSPASTQPFR